ncbi:MAG: hypothetical protein IKK85_00930 [Clostridia bacterium]|nr:hypothetical protein [Clostridia bacterium]
MKEYKRSVGWSILSSFLSLVTVGIMLGIFMYFFPGSEISMMLGIVAVVFVLLIISFFSDMKQKVMLDEGKIIFKDFKIKNVRSFAFGSLKSENTKQDMKVFDIPCSKIEKMEAGRDIIFWRYNLHLTVEDMPTCIVIPCTMSEHKELYSALITHVEKTKPSVYVDRKLTKYLYK